MKLVHLAAHVNPALAHAVKASARAARMSISDYIGSALLLKQEVAGLIEPVRMAMAESAVSMAAQVRAAADEGVARVINDGAAEREELRQMISDFIAGLQAVMRSPAEEKKTTALR
jgi:hypothetical protein